MAAKKTLYPYEEELDWIAPLLELETPKRLPALVDLGELPALKYADGKHTASERLLTHLIRALTTLGEFGSLEGEEAIRAAFDRQSLSMWLNTLFGRWEERSYHHSYTWLLGAFGALGDEDNLRALELAQREWARGTESARRRAKLALRVYPRVGSDRAFAKLRNFASDKSIGEGLREEAWRLFTLAAEQRGELAEELEDELFSILDELRGLTSPKTISKFIKLDELPPLYLKSAPEEPLDQGVVKGVIRAFASGDGLYLVEKMRRAFEPRSAGEFAVALFEMWEKTRFNGRYEWVLDLIGGVGGDRAAIALEPHMYRWPYQGDTMRKRAIRAMRVFVSIDTPTSLMILVGLCQMQGVPSVYDAAVSCLSTAARARHVSWRTLSDQVVPDCGLDRRGTREFDLGGRTLTLILDEEFEPRLVDEAGERYDDIPALADGDAPTLHEHARQDWALMQSKLSEIIRVQTKRMEGAMVTGRRWRIDAWREAILNHPLMLNFARRLVWGIYDVDNTLVRAFRATEDHSLVDVEDEEVELNTRGKVGLVHPVELSQRDLQRWAEHFADYEIFAPFQQLERAIYRVEDEEREAFSITRYASDVIAEDVLRRVMTEEMWRRDTSGYTRRYFYKVFSDHGVTAYVDLAPGLQAGWWEPQNIPGVRFHDDHGVYPKSMKRRGELRLDAVPPVVFSEAIHFVELMRGADS